MADLFANCSVTEERLMPLVHTSLAFLLLVSCTLLLTYNGRTLPLSLALSPPLIFPVLPRWPPASVPGGNPSTVTNGPGLLVSQPEVAYSDLCCHHYNETSPLPLAHETLWGEPLEKFSQALRLNNNEKRII